MDTRDYLMTGGTDAEPEYRATRGNERTSGFKDTIGRTLESAADRLRAKSTAAGREGSSLGEYGATAADRLDRAASYVRDANTDKVKRDLEDAVHQIGRASCRERV